MDLEENKYLFGGLALVVAILGAGFMLMDGGNQAAYSSGGTGTGDTLPDSQNQQTETMQEENQDSSSGNVVRVDMSGTSFQPSTIQVQKGDKIKFVNTDGYAHEVKIDALGIDRTVSGGQSTTVTVDQSGTFDLVCPIHAPSMTGEIQAS